MTCESADLGVRLEKRQRLIESYKKQAMYLEYKKVCGPDDPQTPRDLVSTKRLWEGEVYRWRTAIKAAHERYTQHQWPYIKFDAQT